MTQKSVKNFKKYGFLPLHVFISVCPKLALGKNGVIAAASSVTVWGVVFIAAWLNYHHFSPSAGDLHSGMKKFLLANVALLIIALALVVFFWFKVAGLQV